MTQNETNKNLNHIIGENLKLLRKVRQISGTTMAKMLDMTFQQYYKYEQGVSTISVANLDKIAKFYNVKVEAMLKNEMYSKINTVLKE